MVCPEQELQMCEMCKEERKHEDPWFLWNQKWMGMQFTPRASVSLPGSKFQVRVVSSVPVLVICSGVPLLLSFVRGSLPTPLCR